MIVNYLFFSSFGCVEESSAWQYYLSSIWVRTDLPHERLYKPEKGLKQFGPVLLRARLYPREATAAPSRRREPTVAPESNTHSPFMSPAVEFHQVRKEKPNKKRKNRPKPDVGADAISVEGPVPVAEEEEVRHEEENEDKCHRDSDEEKDDAREARDGDDVGDGAEETAPSAKKKKKGFGILTSEPFSRLPLSDLTMKAIQEMGFENMTQVTSRFIMGIFQI